jgi:hypothetical protein
VPTRQLLSEALRCSLEALCRKWTSGTSPAENAPKKGLFTKCLEGVF